MIRITSAVFACAVLAGCASTSTPVGRPSWSPSASEIRSTFNSICPPYRDPFARFAYKDGFIRAYSLGPCSLGALLSVPEPFQEEKLEEAYRRGWSDGAKLAFRSKNAFKL